MSLHEVVWGLFTIIASIGGSWFVSRRSLLSGRASDAHVEAVKAILPTIAHVRALVHKSSVQELKPADVESAMHAFEDACLQHEAALPRELAGLRRSVRASVGNYFGAASVVAIDARATGYPLSEPEPYWQEISETYLEYVMNLLQRGLVQAKTETLIRFHEWRREDDPHGYETA